MHVQVAVRFYQRRYQLGRTSGGVIGEVHRPDLVGDAVVPAEREEQAVRREVGELHDVGIAELGREHGRPELGKVVTTSDRKPQSSSTYTICMGAK